MHGPNMKAEKEYTIESMKQRISELERVLQMNEEKAQTHRKTMETLSSQESELHATLYGIGDAVISTDQKACVTRMNRTAEELTGWTENEAIGTSLEHVFRIIDETTRLPAENPAHRVLQKGVVCTLANHTILISKDGRETPIADSGAPIFDSRQDITGVVLIFRDQTEERLNQRFIETRLSLIEFAANHTLEELLTRALDDVGEFVNSPIGFYHFIESDQKTLSLQQWSTRTLKEFCRAHGRGMHYDIHQAGVWVDCIREGKPVIHNDYASLPHKKGFPEGHAHVLRELVVPVFRDGKMVAILGVGNKPVDYTQKDVEIVSFLADVTWEIVCRKRAEEELRNSNEMFRAIINAAPTAIVGLDLDGNVRSVWNKAAEKMFGWSAGEVMGRPLPTVPEDRREQFRKFREREQKGIPMDGVEVCRQRRDGSPIDCSIYSSPFYDAEGVMIGNIAVMVDITEQKIAEQARLVNLKYFESMDRVNRAIQGANDLEQMMHDVLDEVLSILDCERVYLLYPCDPDAEKWTVPMERSKPGYTGSVYSERLEIPMTPGIAKTIRVLLDGDGPLQYGSVNEHPLPENISERYGAQSMIAMALFPKTGKAWQFGIHQCSSTKNWTADDIMLVREIGRRLTDGLTSLLMYRNLQQNEKFLNNIVENIPDMIFVKDAQTLKFVSLNQAGEKLLGCSRDELLGKKDYDFFPKELADFFTNKDREALEKKTYLDIAEEKIITRGNDKRILHTKKIPILDETGEPKYLLGISEDITEYKTLEEQFRQAQKMESVGRLAGGVAHDFNNLLSVIMGNVELALGKVGHGRQLIAHLHGIQKAAESSADLTRQLLAFARKQTIIPKVLDLNKTVEGMLKMLRRLIGEDINLSWQPSGDVIPVRIDPSQIDQILVNMCVNAQDAIENVGKITIETENITIDETYCAAHAGFHPGTYALLAVSDNGCGMSREILDKIFEPFYTTKELGKGTGLGLSTVYGIVKQNNGFINVYSEPGQGTVFKIFLPRHESEGVQVHLKREPLSMAQGNETILVVEDEQMVLELTCEILSRLGYRVLSAISPEEAIRVAKEYGDPIHLLITDVIMPGMNGPDLSNAISAIHPEIVSLYMSGYTGNVIVHHGVLDEGFNFIQKPFSAQIISEKIREVLEKG